MIIYADELLIKNFIMTYLILIITGEILCKKYRKRDLICGSIIASIITLISIIYDIENNIILKAIILSIIVSISFKQQKIKEFIIEVTFILAITFLIGGVLESSLNNYYEIIICGVISIVSMKKYNEYYKKKKWKIRNQYKLTLEVENKKIELKAFLDTGNFLSTNIKNESVIVISKEAIKNKISSQILNLLEKGEIGELPFYIFKNIRTINYSVLNTEIKMMYGLKVKDIKIESENCSIVCDAVIVLSQNIIKESEALIGISLLEGGFENGNHVYVKAKSKEIIC